MAQRRTQLQVQDLRTISFQSWRATAQQDKRDDLEANQQTVRVRIASMRLGDESEEHDSGNEREEEEDAKKLMLENQIRHLPVFSDEHLVGIISMRDVFNS